MINDNMATMTNNLYDGNADAIARTRRINMISKGTTWADGTFEIYPNVRIISSPHGVQNVWTRHRVSIYNIVDGILKGKLSSLTEDSSSETGWNKHPASCPIRFKNTSRKKKWFGDILRGVKVTVPNTNSKLALLLRAFIIIYLKHTFGCGPPLQ